MATENLSAGTAGTHTAPAPRELLQHLAGWLSACKYADDHPWRQAIAATLAEHPAGTALAGRPLPHVPDIGDRVQFELAPVLTGLAMLTNTVRVLQALSDHASLSESFYSALTEACPTWCDPMAHGDDASMEAVVADLARYAADLCAEVLAEELSRGAA